MSSYGVNKYMCHFWVNDIVASKLSHQTKVKILSLEMKVVQSVLILAMIVLSNGKFVVACGKSQNKPVVADNVNIVGIYVGESVNLYASTYICVFI